MMTLSTEARGSIITPPDTLANDAVVNQRQRLTTSSPAPAKLSSSA